MTEKACPKCKRITHNDICPVCPGKVATSDNWSGLLIVLNPDNSKVAEELNITLPGEYALRVK
ncbi:MAG: transcription elongation factor subunit Spt4 [Methanobrevibacter boviskoreani]|jgi:DNA-directed RNA polymerase subunit E"|uniref:transcription elongation factor subunit Spt4 n=1 Tax=Methanobrevibacter TaxID=2172 RepID=UPI0003348789|nr:MULTISPECIES: transcription elongation factor subunit Spt4 [Methanobrevibacter]AGN16611.1 DNA-directed RNA polymerase subunit E'' RpoE2 [Methanobrevibacter sp. AbM4]MCI6774755.1 DNA-directed RNA polymerase, subunit E'' [Methanobrevibacter boviskoreani]MCI6930566.1 DNA-directed RNA polymerase, subunit E'' [Methanobrevibacter boviskoreani]MDD6256725.1 DNA-directed RNA polymerase, subunit E'' [Methanobrevibacter boviskoreani]MDY5614701.1 transcription elongation factor subunit Spt4 [Methanobre